MATNTFDLGALKNVKRIESFTKNEMSALCMDMTHSVYQHDEVYGQYCTVEEYIDCPPDDAFKYLANVYSLGEWTYSLRNFGKIDDSGLVEAIDAVGGKTKIFTRTESCKIARTVDYHCSWDQGEELWMIYLMRVVDANIVLGKKGSVILWTNCRHKNYDNNPYPELAPSDRKIWVGEMWPFFYAGHWVEIQNLKSILEHRHRHQLGMEVTL